MKESLGSFWGRRCEIDTASSDVVGMFSKRISGDIKRAMNAGQDSAVIFIFRETHPRQIFQEESYFEDERVWFPLDKLVKRSLLSTPLPRNPKTTGYRIHKRFIDFFEWLTEMGIDYYLTPHLELVAYWTPSTLRDEHHVPHDSLYSHYASLMQFPDINESGDNGLYPKIRTMIFEAMRIGQTRANVCFIYKNTGYEKKTEQHVVDTSYICHNAIDNEDVWVITSKHHKALVDWLVEIEELSWTLQFHNDGEHASDCCVLIAYWK